ATRPGETAEDDNVYASALASVLPTPGLTAEQVFKEAQLKVADLSKGLQIPWTEDGLLTRFRFKDAVAAITPLPTQPPAPTKPEPSRCEGVEALVDNEKRCLKPKDTFKDCPECPEMIVVPAGEFMMGSEEEPGEKPVHKVTIARSFAVGKFEVTFAEWD